MGDCDRSGLCSNGVISHCQLWGDPGTRWAFFRLVKQRITGSLSPSVNTLLPTMSGPPAANLHRPASRSLTEGSIVSALVRLSLPIVMANILQVAYQLTDTFWAGQLSAEALAAV